MINTFGDLKIGTRLGAGFALLLLLLCCMGAAAILQASYIYEEVEELSDNWLPSVQILGDIRASANAVRRASLRSVLEAEQNGKQTQRALHDQALKNFDLEMQAYQKLVSSAEEEKLYQSIERLWNDYIALDTKLLELSEAGESGFGEARVLSVGESASAFAALTKLIEADVELNSKGAAKARASAKSSYHTALQSVGALIATALAVGACIAVLLTRSITGPIQKAVSIAQTVAQGYLTSRIESGRKDEVGQLLRSLKAMNDKLADVVSTMRNTTESVTVASNQIATGNMDLSSRTEEQAASLEETAASMTELAETVRLNAESARQANSLAANAREMTGTGRRDVEIMVETIKQVSADSEKIAEITAMIEGIAFQTNILALNAAVEAARAGEHGRGFAVVAGEVRSLAQRAATAAKEIKELIEVSTEKVRQGAQRAVGVNGQMSSIDQAISRVSDVIAEISAASEEQAKGIDQVHQAISQIDEVTQQNAALVEESAAAAQSMQEQAGKMKQEVMFFKLGEEISTVGRVPSAQLSPPTQQTVPLGKRATPMPRKSIMALPSGGKVAANRHRAQASAAADDWATF